MPREIHRLKPVKLNTYARAPGTYQDGGGLVLQVTSPGVASWIYRYALRGKRREMGLGPLREVGLAEARQRAGEARKLRAEGIDPIEHRREQEAAAKLAAARALTFKGAAVRHIENNAAGWRNAKHRAQWSSTLETYAYPVIGDLPVPAIDTPLVLKVLEPIWKAKPETANRLRGRIETILDGCTARGERQGDNPARWRGHLSKLLPKQSKVRRVKHRPALPYTEVGAFMGDLAQQEGIAARALRFLILTWARTSEVTGARWAEIDMHEATWTVPAERIKGGSEHRVPLSKPAMAILREAQVERNDRLDGGYVFPGGKRGRPMSEMAMLALLRRMGRSDITVHGFRSTARDWAAEQTSFPRELAEKALAHVVGGEAERAYQRGDLFEKRRRLMDAWAQYCSTVKGPGEVVPMRRRKA